MDKTMAAKAENDAAAYIRSLAEERKRNAEWAEKAVRESVSVTEQEALKLHIIDYVAQDLKTLLEYTDGKIVQTSAGPVALHTSGVKTISTKGGIRHRILNLISDPNVAYLLMLLGFYGIFFELTNPGTVLPGVLGALSLILALYAFQTLPVNYAGLLLIILAIILFVLEIKVSSFGMLTLGGTASMILGSMMLFDSPLPFLRLSIKVILPAVIMTALFFSWTIYLVVKAHRRRPITGAEGLIDETGTAKTDIFHNGQALIHGEIWQAQSDIPVNAGDEIVVESVHGLKLQVRKLV